MWIVLFFILYVLKENKILIFIFLIIVVLVFDIVFRLNFYFLYRLYLYCMI